MTFLALYFLSGFIGTYVAWLYWVLEFETYRCPTPRAIVVIIFGGFAGPFSWVPAIAYMAMYYSGHGRFPYTTWWTTPVCRKRR